MSQKYSKEDVMIKKINYQAERLTDGLAFFDFYDPSQQLVISNSLSKIEEVGYEFFGGHTQSERRMLCIYPSQEKGDIPWPISLCKANVKLEINHRMVLGAVMQLGISRETIGDIIIDKATVQIIAKGSIADYIGSNLSRLNSEKVQFEINELSTLYIPKQTFKEENIIVSSFRLDAIISAAYLMSRELAANLIKKRGVKVNHIEQIKPHYNVQVGDLISVKGKGRFILDTILGLTKKDRNKISIKKYV